MFKKLVSTVALSAGFAVGLSFVGVKARAQSALGTANAFNVFVFGDMSVSGGEAEGAVAVGGNLTMSNSYNTTVDSGTLGVISGLTKINGTTGTLNNVSLYVGNSVTASSDNIDSGGSVYVRNTESGTLNFNGGSGMLYTGSPAFLPAGYSYAVDPNVFKNQQTFSQNQSALLATLSPTLTSGQNYSSAMTELNQNEYDIDASKISGSTKYITITASFLASLNNPRIVIQNLQDTDTLVINVTGTSLTSTNFSLQNANHNNHYANILWNFASATTLDINNVAFEGSILAPYAAVDQNQLLEGNLIANSLTGHGYEEHFITDDAAFTGTLPNATAVPEPGVYACAAFMVLTGSAFALRSRRRKPQAN